MAIIHKIPAHFATMARMTKRPPIDVRLDTSLEAVLEHAVQGAGAGVLATLVSVAGSTYRKPGARMLIMGDGTCHGLLSGGCLEADLALHAREVLESGTARAVEYDMRVADDALFGIGAGCEGAMRVLLEPAGAGSLASPALGEAAAATRSGRSTALIVVHESANLTLGTYRGTVPLPPELTRACADAVAHRTSQDVIFEFQGRRTRAFVQFLAPPPHLLICGAGPDAEALASAAAALDWRVSVTDHRPAYAVAARFPRAAVTCAPPRSLRSGLQLDGCHAAVVMSHHLNSDVAYLRELSEAGIPGYVGLLGPAARRRRISTELGPAVEALAGRLRGPVGLDIGAVTPQGIALSIISDIHAWLAGRTDAGPMPHRAAFGADTPA